LTSNAVSLRDATFILRELLSVMVPSLVQARKIGAAEVGIHPAAGLASLSDTAFDVNALDTGPGNMDEFPPPQHQFCVLALDLVPLPKEVHAE
jgi:hypothetical protein